MTPVMSFWPSIYKKIANKEKLIEYRRRFPKDCKYAYMYISKPVKAICGIIYFGDLHDLNDWQKEYEFDSYTLDKINNYLLKYQYGREIEGFQKIKPIYLDDLRKNIKGFVAPQSYLLLENNKELSDYISKNIICIGDKLENKLDNIFPEHICKEY